MRSLFFGLGLAAVFAGCGGGTADSVKDAKKTNADKIDSQKKVELPADSIAVKVSKSDADFLVEAASGSRLETELGQLAEDRSNNSRIKAFGAMMVKDHTMMSEKVRALATATNVTLPEGLSDRQERLLSELRRKRGDDFNRSYIDHMVSDHRDDVHAFENHTKKGLPAITAFASSSLNILQQHLDSAENLKEMLKK